MNPVADGRVILITRRGLAHRLLAAALHRTLDLEGIVVEEPRPCGGGRAARLKERLRSGLGETLFGAGAALKRWVSMSARECSVLRVEGDLQRRAEAHLLDRAGKATADEWPHGVDRHASEGLEHPDTLAWCRARQPELILVFGTSIVRGPMLELAPRGMLNAHCSLLPDYRGTFSEFWQVLHGDLDSAGVTIHYIDESVDTGDIVRQQQTPVPEGVDPYMLRTLNILATLELYPDAARGVLRGEVDRRPQEVSERKAHRARDRTLEKRIALLHGLGHEV